MIIIEPIPTPIIIGNSICILSVEIEVKYVLYTPKSIKITVLLTPWNNNSYTHKKTT